MAFLSEGACLRVRADFFPGAYSSDYKKDNFDEEESRVLPHLRAAYCARCPVFEACYRHALLYPEPSGIWAGTTTTERNELRSGM